VQHKENTNRPAIAEVSQVPAVGRLVAIDPGTKRVGAAVCDEQRIAITRLPVIARSSWKKLLSKIREILTEYDAVGLVVGLPYNFDGSESEMSMEARRIASKLGLSLEIPIFLQDERATTYEARGRLWKQKLSDRDVRDRLDSEAASIILADFIDRTSSS
jgi:putative Holliday junction resolvase